MRACFKLLMVCRLKWLCFSLPGSISTWETFLLEHNAGSTCVIDRDSLQIVLHVTQLEFVFYSIGPRVVNSIIMVMLSCWK